MPRGVVRKGSADGPSGVFGRDTGFDRHCGVTRLNQSSCCLIWPTGSGGIAVRRTVQGAFQKDFYTMTRHTNHASRLTLAVAGLAAALAAVAPASAQNAPNQPPRGWFKACSKQQDVDICNVQNLIMADTGQLMTGISLIDIKGKVNRKVFQITVPTGRMIPPGIGVQIDGGKAQKLDYVICFPDRCVA